MNIGRNWKIESDELNVTLYQRFVRKGNTSDYWRPHSYYSTLTNTLHALVNIEVNRTGLKDLETVNRRIDEIHTWISEALKNTGISTRNATSLKGPTRSGNKGKTTGKRQKVSTSS